MPKKSAAEGGHKANAKRKPMMNAPSQPVFLRSIAVFWLAGLLFKEKNGI